MSPRRATARRKPKPGEGASATPPRPFVAHLLVPPHELLTEGESTEVLQRLGTLAERLPKIQATDPGLRTDAKYLKAREAHEPLAGRLVRIRRPSATAGEAIAYRVIVPAAGE